MTLKDCYQQTGIPNLDKSLLEYGCSLSMMKLLECDYIPTCKLLCWNSHELKNMQHLTIYKHALFGVIVLDRKNHHIFMESSKYKQLYFWCKEKGYDLKLEKDGTI